MFTARAIRPARAFLYILTFMFDVISETIGSLSKDDVDGSENVI